MESLNTLNTSEYMEWLSGRKVVDVNLIDTIALRNITPGMLLEYNTTIDDVIANISKFKNLYTLIIKDCNLTQSPKIEDFHNLITLDLSDNLITHLPDSITKLTYLEDVYFNNNQLSSLPEDIGDLQNLTTLQLSDNQLTSLPDSICDLHKLMVLDLSHNHLTSLPEDIGELDHLDELMLNSNQLIDLPTTLSYLTNLAYLTIHDNPDLNISDAAVEEYVTNIIYNNNYNNNSVNAYQVHKAFDKINKDALFKFIKSSVHDIDVIVADLQTVDRHEFAEYMKEELDAIIIRLPKKNSRRKQAETDIEQIFENVLHNIDYTDEYKKIITYCLKYVSKQPSEFKMAYASNFTYDCAHAYNANGNASAEISCAKGMIERFVTSLVPAAIIMIDTPLFKKKRYAELISIIENVTKDLRGLIDGFAKDCYTEAPESEADFKKCLKRKLADELKGSYNEAAVSKEIDEYVPSFGLYGGGVRKRRYATRKRANKRGTRRKVGGIVNKRATRKQVMKSRKMQRH